MTEVLAPKLNDEMEARAERYVDAFDLLKEERQILEHLYEPLRKALVASNETAKKLTFVCRIGLDIPRQASLAMKPLDRRRSLFRDQGDLELALKSLTSAMTPR